jgi:hypothetical protein
MNLISGDSCASTYLIKYGGVSPTAETIWYSSQTTGSNYTTLMYLANSFIIWGVYNDTGNFVFCFCLVLVPVMVTVSFIAFRFSSFNFLF